MTTPLPRRRALRIRSAVIRCGVLLAAGLGMVLAAQGCTNIINGGQKQCGSITTSGTCSAPATPDACLAADGCSVGPTCVLVYCRTIETESACTAHSACKWFGDPGICVYSTASNPCFGLTEQVCKAHDSCSWQLTCNGQLKDCYGLSETECAAIPHCYMETVPNF